MKERIGIIFGCAILLAACESGDDLANSSQPPSDVQSVEVSTVTEPQAIAPPPVLSNPVNPQAVDPQPATPNATQIGNSDQVSNPEPAQPGSGVQPADAEPAVAGAIPAVVSVPPPQPVEEEIEAPPVDSTPPETAISSQPSALSNKTSATFEFSCSDRLSPESSVLGPESCTLFCQVDVGTPTSCVSPVTLSLVTDGNHTFTVYAVDQAGNKDATPAFHTWTVDTTGPAAPIISSATSGNREVSLTWSPAAESSDSQDYDIAYCAPAGDCAPPSTPQITGVKGTTAVLGGLANCTTYEFFVRTRDVLQNAGPWSSAAVSTPVLLPPGAPTAVEHPWQLQLTWSAVPDAESYVIYHAASSFSTTASATAVPATGTAWEVDFPDTARRYIRLTAKDGSCESTFSPEVSSTPLGSSSSALYTFAGDEANDNFGRSVSSAGDVNGDGMDDVIVGAPYADSDPEACATAFPSRGVVRVYSGATGTILHRFCGDKAGDGLGRSVSSAGDVDGDGNDDLIVGAPYAYSDPAACATVLPYRGVAHVYSGTDGSILRRFCGRAADNFFGDSVSAAGDVNGDGKDDVIVGAPGADYDDNAACVAWKVNRGTARIFSGADGSILHRFCGDAAFDRLGDSVSSAGDVNGDGKDDVIVGAPWANADPVACATVLSGRGIARVYSGADGDILRRFCGDAPGDNLGVSVSSTGDVDGDGRDDVIVGADGADSDSFVCATPTADRGIARVYSGADGAVLHRSCGDSAGDHFGASVAGAVPALCKGRRGTAASCGDVSADGRPEVVVGAYFADTDSENAGKAYVLRLSDGIPPAYPVALEAISSQLSAVSPATPPYGWTILRNNSVAATITGTGSPATYIPGSVSAVFDTIRLTDSKNRSFDTRVATVDWPLAVGLGWPKSGEAAGDTFGRSVSSAGDVDGDGKDDVIVGAPHAGSDPEACGTALTNRGIVRVYSGATGAILHRFCGDAAFDGLGESVSSAGDVNGDGKDDVIVGAPSADFDPTSCPISVSARGVARVYSGATGAVLHRFCGDAAYDFFGVSVSSAGDVNGDGKDDVIVGAPSADFDPTACPISASARGVARVYSGATGVVLHRSCGDWANDEFGISVSSAGDVNGDGKDDVIVGARGADSDPVACRPWMNGRGIARVYSGSDGAILHRFCGETASDQLGGSVSEAGDVDGDGKDDVIVGASWADSDPTECATPLSGRGIARVYSGATGAVLHRFCGDAADDWLGGSVSTAGDVNGDGRDDIIVGSNGADSDPVACPSVAASRGIARVYSGSDGAILLRFCGEASSDRFGASVSRAGDVNADGRPDFIVGALLRDPVSAGSGKAYLYVSRRPAAPSTQPSDLAVGTVTSTSVALSWKDNSTHETGFCVEFRRPTFTWITASCFVPANASTYTVTGLSPKTRYHFRIKSFSASSDSLWSNIAAAATNP